MPSVFEAEWNELKSSVTAKLYDRHFIFSNCVRFTIEKIKSSASLSDK